MRIIPSSKRSVFYLVLGLWFTLLCGIEATAQTCTQSNTPPVNKVGWIKATTVQVY